MTTGDWHKSTESGVQNCVEVRYAADHVQVRDTKNKNGAVLTFTLPEWRAFLTGVCRGEFDVPTD